MPLPGGGFLVADAGHHSLVELAADAETVVRRIGSGERGLVDGAADAARFSEPNGLCLLPPEVAEAVGYDVVVADTVNHALRGLCARRRRGHAPLPATAHQWMQGDGTERPLLSPWDVAWWQDRVWVAMAGIHQLWTFDPVTGRPPSPPAPPTRGCVDGPLAEAWFAQTSGLAADGDRLWLADSETSSLRAARSRRRSGVVHTAVGHRALRLRLPRRPGRRGAAPAPARASPSSLTARSRSPTPTTAPSAASTRHGEVTTLATGLAEPSGVSSVDGDQPRRRRVRRAPADPGAVSTAGVTRGDFAHTTQRPVTDVGRGELELVVDFTPPPGQKVDDRFGPPSPAARRRHPAGAAPRRATGAAPTCPASS